MVQRFTTVYDLLQSVATAETDNTAVFFSLVFKRWKLYVQSYSLERLSSLGGNWTVLRSSVTCKVENCHYKHKKQLTLIFDRVTIPLNFDWLEHYQNRSNRKSNECSRKRGKFYINKYQWNICHSFSHAYIGLPNWLNSNLSTSISLHNFRMRAWKKERKTMKNEKRKQWMKMKKERKRWKRYVQRVDGIMLIHITKMFSLKWLNYLKTFLLVDPLTCL